MTRLWTGLILVTIFGFVVLLWIGTRIFTERPPIPDRVVTSDGTVLDPTGFVISSSTLNPYRPAVAFDGTNFFVAFDGSGNLPTNTHRFYRAVVK